MLCFIHFDTHNEYMYVIYIKGIIGVTIDVTILRS